MHIFNIDDSKTPINLEIVAHNVASIMINIEYNRHYFRVNSATEMAEFINSPDEYNILEKKYMDISINSCYGNIYINGDNEQKFNLCKKIILFYNQLLKRYPNIIMEKVDIIDINSNDERLSTRKTSHNFTSFIKYFYDHKISYMTSAPMMEYLESMGIKNTSSTNLPSYPAVVIRFDSNTRLNNDEKYRNIRFAWDINHIRDFNINITSKKGESDVANYINQNCCGIIIDFDNNYIMDNTYVHLKGGKHHIMRENMLLYDKMKNIYDVVFTNYFDPCESFFGPITIRRGKFGEIDESRIFRLKNKSVIKNVENEKLITCGACRFPLWGDNYALTGEINNHANHGVYLLCPICYGFGNDFRERFFVHYVFNTYSFEEMAEKYVAENTDKRTKAIYKLFRAIRKNGVYCNIKTIHGNIYSVKCDCEKIKNDHVMILNPVKEHKNDILYWSKLNVDVCDIFNMIWGLKG